MLIKPCVLYDWFNVVWFCCQSEQRSCLCQYPADHYNILNMAKYIFIKTMLFSCQSQLREFVKKQLFKYIFCVQYYLIMIQSLIGILNFIIYFAGIIALIKALSALYDFFTTIATRINSKWAQKYGVGSWAIVTGCTQGIGKAFCFELLQLGFKLVLISRSGEKLQRLSHELWKAHPKAQLIIIVVDFSQFSYEMYDKIYAKINNIDISILVNNVGTAQIKKFHSHTAEEIQQLININIKSMTHLTSKVLPQMLERKNKSAIINLSSQSIQCPYKDLTVYTATKAYNDLFSRCLNEDYPQKIDIVSSRPCIVSTAGTNQIEDSTACTARQCARGTLKALGKCKVTAGHWTHIVQSEIASLLGESASRWLGNIKLAQIAAKKQQ